MLRLVSTKALACAALLPLVLAPAASARLAPDALHPPAPVALAVEPASVEEIAHVEDEPFVLRVPAFGQLTSKFGPRWGRMHYGIDLGTLTKLGVVAAAGGTVTRTGYLPHYAGYGKVILIDHGQERVTLYSHLSRIRVVPGEQVEAGAWIGNAGCTGSCTGTHLHFELRLKGVPVDPLPHFEATP